MSFVLLDLHPLFNNDGICWDHCLEDGDVDGEGSTYPAESLPPSNSLCHCQGIPFFFPSKADGARNNVALEGQRLTLPAGKYQSLYLLGAADSGYYAEWLEVEEEGGGSRCYRLELSSWHGFEGPRFGEWPGLVCDGYHSGDLGNTHSRGQVRREVWIWVQHLLLAPDQCLQMLVFPDNSCLHLFAATLESGL